MTSPHASAKIDSSLEALQEVVAQVDEARHKQQPATGFHLDEIKVENHNFDEGLAEGTILKKIEPREGPLEEVPWAKWEDPQAEKPEDQSRGGACVFVPTAPNGTPLPLREAVVLFIHGGGFMGFSPQSGGYDKLASRIAKETGLVVVCPDHPLAGEKRPYHAPAIMKQLLLDALWLLDNDPLTLEPRHFPVGLIFLGDSSGATQVMSSVLMLAQEQPKRLSSIFGALLISPWLDMSCGSPTYISNTFSEVTKTGDVAFKAPPQQNRQEFHDCALCYLGDPKLVQIPAYSPYWLCKRVPGSTELIEALQSVKVPFWMCIGHSETLMGEVLDFATRLRSKLSLEVWLHEGMFHDWVLYSSDDHHFPSKEKAYKNMTDFITRILEPAPTLQPGLNFYVDEW